MAQVANLVSRLLIGEVFAGKSGLVRRWCFLGYRGPDQLCTDSFANSFGALLGASISLLLLPCCQGTANPCGIGSALRCLNGDCNGVWHQFWIWSTPVCFNGSQLALASYGIVDRLFGDDLIQPHGIVAAFLALSGVALIRRYAFYRLRNQRRFQHSPSIRICPDDW